MLEQSWGYWAVLVAANFPAYALAGWACFGGWGEFWRCLRTSVTPEVISMMRGESAQTWFAEFRLFTYIAGCALIVLVEHWGLVKLGWVAGF